MKNIIKMYLFILLFFYKFFLLADDHIDKKILNIISGVYEEEHGLTEKNYLGI